LRIEFEITKTKLPVAAAVQYRDPLLAVVYTLRSDEQLLSDNSCGR
jgi:hypothetical protein